jgi:hypothetical protein
MPQPDALIRAAGSVIERIIAISQSFTSCFYPKIARFASTPGTRPAIASRSKVILDRATLGPLLTVLEQALHGCDRIAELLPVCHGLLVTLTSPAERTETAMPPKFALQFLYTIIRTRRPLGKGEASRGRS